MAEPTSQRMCVQLTNNKREVRTSEHQNTRSCSWSRRRWRCCCTWWRCPSTQESSRITEPVMSSAPPVMCEFLHPSHELLRRQLYGKLEASSHCGIILASDDCLPEEPIKTVIDSLQADLSHAAKYATPMMKQVAHTEWPIDRFHLLLPSKSCLKTLCIAKNTSFIKYSILYSSKRVGIHMTPVRASDEKLLKPKKRLELQMTNDHRFKIPSKTEC